ncbi:M61 family metallopeptidase [Flammeovirga kamogawensis]|uniref:Peptidase M61 n=1 Tax=Flammeovirga kamogawensis TaxID=373891 RepID=A0ABX8H4K2_9BACT|nr:hypothetical protein [Flammeovirga kamogawensis]MBB6463538.1 putative metalloprotease with PDZ domain [Flammeovirga kamogawensis]QWG10594.1 hypothetical protein KM029_24740 [Flammeovirga kamogawensis]TRX63700.1 hypothetical protein EO216_25125 [Flammeovirga kamogawensis]
MKKLILTIGICIITPFIFAQNPKETVVEIDLKTIHDQELDVTVFTPKGQKKLEFVIPVIVPGTYMVLDHIEYFKKLKAYDINGELAKVKKKKNVFFIEGKDEISRLEYAVIDCKSKKGLVGKPTEVEGTVFTENSALINFNMLNGYFEGFEKEPFKVIVHKPIGYYGATSMTKLNEEEQKDVLYADNYFGLIDQPVLYAQPDTTSFVVNGQKFIVAVHNEDTTQVATAVAKTLKNVMTDIDDYSGLTSKEDYYFLMYRINPDRMKGLFKYFGTGMALEHHNSSVYFDTNYVSDSTYVGYTHIAAHEYYHTITPLSLHSEEIHDFHYRNPKMSQHTWMYEGFTDYFANRSETQTFDDQNYFVNQFAFSIETSKKRNKQSMTESSRDIIRDKNALSFISKVMDLMAFYEKGALIAFCLDLEIMERSNGERRLIDAVLEMKEEYKGKYFEDDKLREIMTKYTYPEFGEFYDKYIQGTATPDMDAYCDKLGWEYIKKGKKQPTYGTIITKKNKNEEYKISYTKKNTLGLKKGDIVLSINGGDPKVFYENRREYYKKKISPSLDEILTIEVKRGEKLITLSGSPKMKKTEFPKIKIYEEVTPEQQKTREYFFHEKEIVDVKL